MRRQMVCSKSMSRGTGRSLKSDRGRKIATRLLIAGAAVGAPILAAALLRRRAEPPSPPRWGGAPAGPRGRAPLASPLGARPPLHRTLRTRGGLPGAGERPGRRPAPLLRPRLRRQPVARRGRDPGRRLLRLRARPPRLGAHAGPPRRAPSGPLLPTAGGLPDRRGA